MERLQVAMHDNVRFNSTTPAGALTEFVTPLQQVFVVHHLGIPEMPAAPDWYLVVQGCVRTPLRLTLADLARLPMHQLTAVHECAGSPLRPDLPVRRVANARWRGVKLRTLLELAGVEDEARFVWATGADGGVYPPTGQQVDCYRKDIPLAKAMADEVLLALELDGQPLDVRHGAPVRLVVPGYYATSSVKWLTELSVASTRATAYFSTTLYNDLVLEDGVERQRPVRTTAPHAVLVAPAQGASVVAGPVAIWGWAWAGAGVAMVEVSTDGGARWNPASLAEHDGFAWQRFEFPWLAEAGQHQVLCRATDADGVMQPAGGARNAVMQVEVRVA